MTVKFWGVRGSIPSPGAGTIEFGGNTACVELLVKDQRLIFDGGSGIRMLGLSLLQQIPVQGQVFFSHYHWDHIQGFPFFTPGYVPGNHFRVYGPIAHDGSDIETMCRLHMRKPNFPVPLSLMGSLREFINIKPGMVMEENGIKVSIQKLYHSPESVGYRVECEGKVFAYLSDYEHSEDKEDLDIIALAQNADIAIYDAMYTEEEYNNPDNPKRGWGHSTWEKAVQLAKRCNIKKIVIFHHDPLHDDTFLSGLEKKIIAAHPSAIVAKEGMTITV